VSSIGRAFILGETLNLSKTLFGSFASPSSHLNMLIGTNKQMTNVHCKKITMLLLSDLNPGIA